MSDYEHDNRMKAYQQWSNTYVTFETTNFDVFVAGIEYQIRKEKTGKRQVLNPLGFSKDEDDNN